MGTPETMRMNALRGQKGALDLLELELVIAEFWSSVEGYVLNSWAISSTLVCFFISGSQPS